MRRIIWGVIFGLFFFAVSLSATVIRVPQDQPTIQAGIDAAVNGDTVLVSPGTYAENINFNGKSIVLKGAKGSDSTTINPTATGTPIISIVSGEDSTTTIDGFKITDGAAENAGGIHFYNSKGVVKNNIFDANKGSPYGGAIASRGLSRVQIINNVFQNTTAASGVGAIYCESSYAEISRNLIIDNSSSAVVFVYRNSTAKVINNTFANNVNGSLSVQEGSKADVRNNIFFNNTTYSVHAGGPTTDTVTIDYNDFVSSPLVNTFLGIGNLATDPLFVGGIPFDYHLLPGSPCIDTGDPSTPIPPSGGSRVDMGVFEFLYAPSFYLIGPMSNTDLRVRKPTLIWSLLRSTEGVVPGIFRALLSPNSNFSNADSSPVLTDTAWNVPFKLTFGQTFYWKVFAVPDSGDTVFSEVRNFTVLQPDFELFLPSESAQVQMRQPIFIWQKVQDTSIADSFNFYRVILSQNISFTLADTSPVISDTVWKVPFKLDLNQNYFWKVQAVSDSGDTIYSNSTGTFSVQPPPFSLFAPSNSSVIRIRQPSFAWQAVRDTSIPDTFIYRVILSKNGGFSPADTSPVISDTVWKVSYKLDLNQNYFWKVQAIYESGDTILSDGVRTFSMAQPLFSLVSPSNSSRVLVKQPVFDWAAVRDTSIPDVFSYRLIYAKNPSFTSATSSPVLTDTFWQPPANLDIATTYYWKVFAFYSGAGDTVFPQQNFNFLLAPTLLAVPGDRPTIQQAIDISINGDTVLVAPGTYTQNILFKGKRIKLISEEGPAVTTIAKLVDGFELVNFSTGEDSTTVLSGFTLTGARLVPSGSAINLRGASPIIENNYIMDNSGQTAVIWAEGGAPKIRRCLIVGDSGDAAIRFFNGSAGEVINCTISDNFGDGIRVQAGEPVRITNNIITANSGYGIRSMGGSNVNSTITYNDLFANTAGHFFAAIPGEGNIFSDPLYRGGNPFDYHLLSLSPCVDSGDPGFPIPPGGGNRIDMGAFEYNTSTLAGDLNLDGILSAPDVVLELNCAFLGTGDCPLTLADLNCDNSITPADVVILLNAVFLGIPPPCS